MTDEDDHMPNGTGTDHSADEVLRPEHLYKAVGLLLLVLFVYANLRGIAEVLLIVYAAAILGVAFHAIVGLIPNHRRGVTAGLGLLIFGGIALTLWFAVPALADQVRGLSSEVPSYRAQLEVWAQQFRQATGLNIDLFGSRSRSFFRGMFSDAQMIGTARGLMEGLFLPLVLIMGGLYAAAKPNDKLLTGFLRAVPPQRRDAFRHMLQLLAHRLRAWVKGTLLSMLIVGVLTVVGFWIIGVPYPLLLATKGRKIPTAPPTKS